MVYRIRRDKTKRTHRTHSAGFKAKAALAAINCEKTLPNWQGFFDVHPAPKVARKSRLQECVAGVFGFGPSVSGTAPAVDLKLLHATIGELTLENVFYPVCSSQAAC